MVNTYNCIPVLSVIRIVDLSLPVFTWGLILVNVKIMSNFSVLSTILSHVTGMLTILLASPAANVILIGLESKSTPNPMRA